MRLGWPLLLACFWLGLGTAGATTFLQFQSTALGDGWFQYQLQAMKDPFFVEADITSVGIGFTNEIDHNSSQANWTNSDWNSSYSTWSFNSAYPTPPYQETFLIRSSETGYKLGTNFNGSIILMSLILNDYYPHSEGGIFSQNVVGYAFVPCLVPCRPEEADGSPTNFVFTLKLLPDVSISQLLQTDGYIYGVDFIWDGTSTFVLQGSPNLNNWTNIAYVWSDPPETVWTTDRNLADFGSFFRVEMVSNGHNTNLPPLNSNVALTSKAVAKTSLITTTPRVTGCKPAGSTMVVNLATQPQQACTVQAMNSHRVILQSQQVSPTGTSATVSFDANSLPSPVYFQVIASK
jgi:hypothetical protein